MPATILVVQIDPGPIPTLITSAPELNNLFAASAVAILPTQIGVLLFSYVSIKLKFAEAPNNSNWLSLYGVSILTGIGFTMSLFVGNLAFVENSQYMDGVKIGVLTGSLLSTVFGYVILLMSSKK